ncbi:MAG: 6-phosphogluconolactonase [Deltaproteobacteria bacterium]|nr:6-phosphogluconolactonase [Deltaproteobacteria bacterium]
MARGPLSFAPRLETSASPTELASARLSEALRAVLGERDLVRLAIPGGSALPAAAHTRATLGVDWNRVALTWVDERCVPVDHAESNRGAARKLGLLDRELGFPERAAPRRVLPLFESGETPSAAVERVTRRLTRDFDGVLDVLLLGMGEDGHVASLFPDRREPDSGSVAHVADSPKPPADRITLTRPMLHTARWSVLVATGESKRPALERLLAGDSRLPAQGLVGLTIVTDLDSASLRCPDERKGRLS